MSEFMKNKYRPIRAMNSDRLFIKLNVNKTSEMDTFLTERSLWVILRDYLKLKGCRNIHITLMKYSEILRVSYEIPVYQDKNDIRYTIERLVATDPYDAKVSNDLSDFVDGLEDDYDDKKKEKNSEKFGNSSSDI